MKDSDTMTTPNIRQKAAGDRNWLERIGHVIPGFRGYLEKEERRATDKLLREHIAQRLDQLRGQLDPVMRDLTDRGGFDMLCARVREARARRNSRLPRKSGF